MAVHAPAVDAFGAAAPVFPGASAAYDVCLAHAEPALLRADFASRDRSALVTSLLAALLTRSDASSIDAAELWQLSVSERHLALLRIVAALDETAAIAVQVACPHVGCGERLEIPLEIDALAAVHAEHAARPHVTIVDRAGTHQLRRPTGEDLRRWFSARKPAEAGAVATMIRDLAESATMPDDPAAAAVALEDFDPLLAFAAEVECPGCGRKLDVPIDLEALALERLERHQARLLREIHRLATAYGWTEAEILAVPAARRARYLALLAEEGSP